MYEYAIARNMDLPRLVAEVNTRAAEGWRVIYMSQNATYFYVMMERENVSNGAGSTAGGVVEAAEPLAGASDPA